jgi:hypothetical protein
MTFDEYKAQVQKLLAPFGMSETNDALEEGYADYCAIEGAFGAGVLSVRRDDDGSVRIYVGTR